MDLLVKETGGRPVLVHGHGNHDLKPIFDLVQTKLYSKPPEKVKSTGELTLFTCNNGHPSLGLLEKSAERLGVEVVVAGRGRKNWCNATDKPQVICEALESIRTEYALYADSRDCLLIGSPDRALQAFHEHFSGRDLVFGADIVNWPPVLSFQRYEKQLAGAKAGRYRFLNGGCWLGRTCFCRKFFNNVARTEPVPEAPDSEQGLLKALLPKYADAVGLDYGTKMFFNCGYVAGDIIEIR